MLDKKNVKKASVMILTFLLVTQSGLAYASDWGRSRHSRYSYHQPPPFYRYHRSYPARGSVVISLPLGFIKIAVGRTGYYYCDGVYYQRHVNRYVVVAPPAGVLIPVPPPDYEPVIVNGATYYVSNGVYYQTTAYGYQVVPAPTVAVIPATPVVQNTLQDPRGESFTVNIPNSKGGYTAVTLKRSGEGFVGPQGEFYETFPSVDQLKVMYANQKT